jgi:hypothetical protein
MLQLQMRPWIHKARNANESCLEAGEHPPISRDCPLALTRGKTGLVGQNFQGAAVDLMKGAITAPPLGGKKQVGLPSTANSMAAGIFVACILAVSPAMHPAIPHSGDIVSFDASHLETAAFTDGAPQATRDFPKESDRSYSEWIPYPSARACRKMARRRSRNQSRTTSVGALSRAGNVSSCRARHVEHRCCGRRSFGPRPCLAIKPTSDEAQWGVADNWSPPFETLQTHRGDCEDYAIVKYVALQAGASRDDVDRYHSKTLAGRRSCGGSIARGRAVVDSR